MLDRVDGAIGCVNRPPYLRWILGSPLTVQSLTCCQGLEEKEEKKNCLNVSITGTEDSDGSNIVIVCLGGNIYCSVKCLCVSVP